MALKRSLAVVVPGVAMVVAGGGVLIKRRQLENPKYYDSEDKAKYADVVDRSLQRAVDLLQAFKAIKK